MYKIVSDGTIDGTTVFDGSGKMIGCLKRIVWEVDLDEGVSCTIETMSGEIKKVDAELEVKERQWRL